MEVGCDGGGVRWRWAAVEVGRSRRSGRSRSSRSSKAVSCTSKAVSCTSKAVSCTSKASPRGSNRVEAAEAFDTAHATAASLTLPLACCSCSSSATRSFFCTLRTCFCASDALSSAAFNSAAFASTTVLAAAAFRASSFAAASACRSAASFFSVSLYAASFACASTTAATPSASAFESISAAESAVDCDVCFRSKKRTSVSVASVGVNGRGSAPSDSAGQSIGRAPAYDGT